MKVFAASLATVLLLALGAAYLLEARWQSRTADAFTTEGSRVGDPGHNLVGPDWYGHRS